MASKYSITIAQVQKDFSRYFKVDTKSYCIWIHNPSFSEDDDLLGIQDELEMMNPLNGSNKDESINKDSSAAITNSIANTVLLPQAKIPDQIQLSFDCQKEDEHSTGLQIVDDIAGRINSTQELMNELESAQDPLPPTDGTHDLCRLVDYWNKPADVTEGEAEADGTIESLIRALAKFDHCDEMVQQEFDSVRSNEETSAFVADVQNSITFETERKNNISDGQEKIKNSTDVGYFTEHNDANGNRPKLLSPIQNTEEFGLSHQQDGVIIHQFGASFQQLGDNTHQVDGNYQEIGVNVQKVGDNLQQSGREEQQATACGIDEELNQYISFHEKKGDETKSTDIDQVLNEIVDGPIIPAAEKIDVSKPSCSSKTDVSVTPSPNQQQSSPMSFDEPFVFDFENNITSNQYRIMYEVVPDPNNPAVYVLRPSTTSTLTNLVSENGNMQQIDLFDSSMGSLMRLVKPCCVVLKDCLIKHSKRSTFDTVRFWTGNCDSNRSILRKPAVKKRSMKIQSKAEAIKPKKTKAIKKCRKGDIILKKREIVIDAPTQTRPIEIKKNQPKRPIEIQKIINISGPIFETTTSPVANQPLTMERKMLLTNDWLQESSQATPPDNNMDVNELLQDANLFISSDIEDDAFQLAKYMESIEQNNNESQNTDSINPTPSNILPQRNDRRSMNYSTTPWNAALKSGNSFSSEQPLDLSMKQNTPMSTDTGFGSDSFLSVTQSYQNQHEVSQAHSKLAFDNSNTNIAGNGIKKYVPSKISTEKSNTGEIKRNQAEQNYIPMGGFVKRKETKTNVLPWICETKPATSTTTEKKRKSSIVKTATPKKKTRPTAVQKPESTSIVETPKTQSLFQSHASSTDLAKQSLDYSTDLDYEPSDDDGDDYYEDGKSDADEKNKDEKIKLSDNMEEKKSIVTGTVPDNNYPKKWERLVIKIPNNQVSSSRVVVVGTSSSSSQNVSQAKVKPEKASAPVNIVEPLPTILSKKPKPVTTIARVQIIRNLHYGQMVPPGPNDTLKRQMMFVFNWPCFNYLNGKDCGVICTFNHTLPTSREIFEKAILFSNETIMYMYHNFIAKSHITFNLYFDMISETFGLRKMETSLISAINDCERREKISFFKCIYRGLVLTGLSKRHALTKITDCCSKTKSFYNVILEIMIETDPLYFVEFLKQYYWHGTINSTYMLKLLQQVLDNPAPSLVTVFVDILDKYSNSDVCDIGTFKLIILKAAFLVIGDLNLTRKWNVIESRIK